MLLDPVLHSAVIILHRTGKAETAKLYRESSDIKAAVDTAYLIEKTGEDSDETGSFRSPVSSRAWLPARTS